jgi:hypothetical protein
MRVERAADGHESEEENDEQLPHPVIRERIRPAGVRIRRRDGRQADHE